MTRRCCSAVHLRSETDVRTHARPLPRMTRGKEETKKSDNRGRRQPSGNDDGDATASSVLTGAVRSERARARERKRERGGEREARRTKETTYRNWRDHTKTWDLATRSIGSLGWLVVFGDLRRGEKFRAKQRSPSPRFLSLSLFVIPLSLPLSFSLSLAHDERRTPCDERATIGRNSCWWRPRQRVWRSAARETSSESGERVRKSSLAIRHNRNPHENPPWWGMTRKFRLRPSRATTSRVYVRECVSGKDDGLSTREFRDQSLREENVCARDGGRGEESSERAREREVMREGREEREGSRCSGWERERRRNRWREREGNKETEGGANGGADVMERDG